MNIYNIYTYVCVFVWWYKMCPSYDVFQFGVTVPSSKVKIVYGRFSPVTLSALPTINSFFYTLALAWFGPSCIFTLQYSSWTCAVYFVRVYTFSVTRGMGASHEKQDTRIALPLGLMVARWSPAFHLHKDGEKYILTCEVASAAQSILLQWLCDPSVVFSCFCWTPHISATRRVGQGVEDGKRLEMRRMGLKFNFQTQRPQARNWHVKLHLPPNRFCCSGYVIHLLCSAVFAGHLTSQPLCTMYLLVWHEPHRTGELLSKLEAKLERPRPRPAVGRDSFLKASAQAFDIS